MESRDPLALTPGTRLGVWEITAPIGDGRMGQVYRAHDTKLGRDVARRDSVSDPRTGGGRDARRSGRWLAYQSNESERNEVNVRAFTPSSSGQGGKWRVSNNGGNSPHWARTGHELVYRAGGQLLTVSYAVNGNTFVAEKPRVWIAAHGGGDWDLAADGKRVAVVMREGIAQAPQQEHEIAIYDLSSDRPYWSNLLRAHRPIVSPAVTLAPQ